jgi:diamine N-acetyltransferase
MPDSATAGQTAGLLIRFAAADDFEQVRRHYGMVQDAHAAHMPDTFRPMQPADLVPAHYSSWLSGETLMLIAEIGGTVAGSLLAMVGRSEEQGGYRPCRTVYIFYVVTEPALRRRGVARALMAAAAEWGVREQAERIDLAVWSFNADALAFYRKLGFAVAYTGMQLASADAVARLGGGHLPSPAPDDVLEQRKPRWQWPKWLWWR